MKEFEKWVIDGDVIIKSETGKNIGMCFVSADKDETQANASLLSLSPEMYDVLTDVKSAMDNNSYNVDFDQLHQKVNAVINKYLERRLGI